MGGVKVVYFSPSHKAVHGVLTHYHLSKHTFRVLDKIRTTYLFEGYSTSCQDSYFNQNDIDGSAIFVNRDGLLPAKPRNIR